MFARCIALFFLFLAACGSDSSSHSLLKIGVDPTWFPLQLGELQPFVNGYTEDFLVEMASEQRMEFIKAPASWDNLISSLREKKYDAIISSLPPYSFNQAEFEFSNSFLDLGPVLVSRVDSNFQRLEQLQEKLLGVLVGGGSSILVAEHPTVVLRTYPTIPDLLEDLQRGEIDAVLLENLFAWSYVRHLFQGTLHITSKPLTNTGLRLITRKGELLEIIDRFNKQVSKKNTSALQQKWNLA